MSPKRLLVLALACVSALSASNSKLCAQSIRHDELRFSRRVIVNSPGPQLLSIDLELLAGAEPSLADLRILDDAGREVPYLIIPPRTTQPTWHEAVTVRPIVAMRGESGFEADLGRTRNIDRIRVEGLAVPLMKRLRLEGSTDRQRYLLLVPDATLFDLPEEGLRQVELGLVPGEFKTLRIAWDDRSSSPVGLPKSVLVRLFENQAGTEPLLAKVPFDVRQTRKALSQWRIHLPGRALPITALVLYTKQEQLSRRARISEPRLEGGKLESHLLGTSTLRRATHSGLVAANLRIPIERPEGNELVLTVDNGNNPPLGLDEVSLELQPQPSLYFEAKSTGSLVMRYGSKTASAPEYDLEVERDGLAAKKTSRAEFFGPVEELNTPAVQASSSVSNQARAHGSRVDAQQFSFSRAIVSVHGGMQSVRLDPAVLAHSHGLEDLRILDVSSQQVPYIIEHESEPLVVELIALELSDKERPRELVRRQTAYRLRLPFAGLPSSRLVLTTEHRIFRRQVSLNVVVPAREATPSQIVEIAQAMWFHGDPNQDIPALELAIPGGTEPELVLAIEDGDNDKLPLMTCRLELPANSLKFFRMPDESLKLYYGSKDLSAPSYDLALLADELKTLPTDEAKLGPEPEQTSAPTKGNPMQRGFWAVLVFTVVVLVTLIARLIRKNDSTGAVGP